MQLDDPGALGSQLETEPPGADFGIGLRDDVGEFR